MKWLCDVRGRKIPDAALVYADNDAPIFPLIGKLPPKGFEGGFHRATTDKKQIREWFDKEYPGANIGWPLPPNHCAIDIDPRHGGDFARTMIECAHRPWPFTLRQFTGGGGFHWIYRGSVHQGSGWFDGIDTRAAGKGYLLVEPSVHPQTRGRYEWRRPVMQPVPMPDYLAAFFQAPKEQPATRAPYVPPQSGTLAASRRHQYAEKAIAGIAKKVASAREGFRNDLLNWGWWHALGYRDVIDESTIRAELTKAAQSCGLGDAEIKRVLR